MRILVSVKRVTKKAPALMLKVLERRLKDYVPKSVSETTHKDNRPRPDISHLSREDRQRLTEIEAKIQAARDE